MTTPKRRNVPQGKPAKPSSSARKRTQPKASARKYDDGTREGALELFRDGASLADVHRQTGVPKPTLTRWRQAAGVPNTVNADRARLAAATAASLAVRAEARLTMLQQLERNVESAGAILGALLEAGVEFTDAVAELDPSRVESFRDPDSGRVSVAVDDPAATAALKRAQALTQLPVEVRDLVGIHTRGIHDLQLLKGEATERGAVVVEFALPRPPRPVIDGEVVT
ncbi:hypothetical protein [uncultured Arsenicicoccus sp.]|uniref:hypothetical protein n=1 Tax=uncultured Arsenicicoccus sp. TaxID=491339 RepID=UPI002592FC43|nr:hypothetical protein [uncultured Arsenicicoccus sp.]